jgi:2,4-dienoyl-CoA reductase-like NADH-dependent reductase (Old Yellow Enzyme family)
MEPESAMSTYRRVASLKSPAELRLYASSVSAAIPCEETLLAAPESPLAQPLTVHDRTIGNRFAILPMEGWDGTVDGRPSDLTFRRWRRFGASGAKLIWGGEAVAVHHDGRANPNQLVINDHTATDIQRLREALVAEHSVRFGDTSNLLVGLQLTHSGRFSQPNSKKCLEPKILYRHPLLDPKFQLPDTQRALEDREIEAIVGDFVSAARFAQRAGFAFVDIKHCHGYLGHEFLSAVDRPGCYGGSLENRPRFLREIVAGIRAEAPGLRVGVRISAADWIPFQVRQSDGVGQPQPRDESVPYRYAFGGDGTGLGIDLTEPCQLLELLASLGVRLVCVTVGCPYYNPHRQRPAFFPPSDGYLPPEDPLVGVACQLQVTARLKAHQPNMAIVGSGYSYLQDWLPQVGQAVVRAGQADFVGLGRVAISYPELPADVLAGHPLRRKQVCRTFSDCTTAPRNGLVSGCYPLDSFYKSLPEAEQLARRKSVDGV